MGVAGLWDLLRPAGQPRSLVNLAVVDGFEKNLDGKRGYRIGIDASIWFFHAKWGQEGENPELRTLFFRLCRLAEAPFLPLFVFDGPYRPEFKRGQNINRKHQNALEPGVKRMVEAFGWEWKTAPGEAEAELAYLNKIGVIDAVLSDDVDTFLFGAKVVVRNPSATLSGNRSNPVKNADGRDDGKHSMIYRSKDLETHEDVRLTRNGMILIGLMKGGDYDEGGLHRCGPNIARGLARCGFGDTLVNAYLTLPSEAMPAFINSWRAELIQELRTNSRGIVGKKYVALANSIPNTFPSLEILKYYVTPVTSESRGKIIDDSKWWTRDMDIAEVAACCEQFFEWGIKDIILKRFRTVLWPGACGRILRQAAREQDRKGQSAHPLTPQKAPGKRPPAHLAVGTPSKLITRYFSKLGLDSPEKVQGPLGDDQDDEDPLMIKIHSSRQHASTDKILEYRVEIAPAQLVVLAESGIQGLRSEEFMNLGDTFSDLEEDDEGGSKKGGTKPPPDPQTHLRVWLPASMMEYVQPRLVEEFEAKEEAKRLKKEGKGKGRKKANVEGDDEPKAKSKPKKSPAKAKGKAATKTKAKIGESDDEEEELPRPAKAKAKAPGKENALARAKSALVFSAEEEESDADVPSRLKKPTPPPKKKAAAKKPTTKPAAKAFAFTMSCPDDDEEVEEEEEIRSPSPTLLFPSEPLPPAPKLKVKAPVEKITKPKPASKPKVRAPRTNSVADFFNDSFSSDEAEDQPVHADPFELRPPPFMSRATSSSSSTAVSRGTSVTVGGESSDVSSSRSGKASRKATSPLRGSSSDADGPRKSPRKSPLQTSPRKTAASLQPRSPSPSPKPNARVVAAPPKAKAMEYIEISSSSDDEPAPRARSTSIKPVVAAKKPVQKELGFAVRKTAKPAATKPRRPVVDDNVVFIDLT